MAKATTVTIERTSTARIPLGRLLSDDEFASICTTVERIGGVHKAYLDVNGQVMVVELAPTHTSRKKGDPVLVQAAKAAGVSKIDVVPVV